MNNLKQNKDYSNLPVSSPLERGRGEVKKALTNKFTSLLKYFLLVSILFFSQENIAQKRVWVNFETIANEKKIVLNDSIYTNKYGEKYNITKLKYYISNLKMDCVNTWSIQHGVSLIDAKNSDSFSLKQRCRLSPSISFTLGLDSAINAYGPQSDSPLDPLNDMYWAWNSGFVNFKLEGNSTSSTAINNKIEQHIGGYKDKYKTYQTIVLPIKKFTNHITIQMNLDAYWDNIKIAENATITSPGDLAKKAADGFVKMFSIKDEN